MAPARVSKRPRAYTDDYESVNGSTAHQQRGKRPRQSPANDSDEDDVSEAPSRRSENDDEADDDGFNDPATLQRATQMVEKQLRDQGAMQNLPAECGIIEEIQCTNFMCHERLTITLGPLINFIIGHNGSGKSAVLTALTLCLGGKTTATNRGQNLKAFIKEGRDQCTLSVKIKNEGSAAFRPDLYGSSIIVERMFSKSSSGFKVKAANGKVVSIKKADVEDITDAFAFQIDNPMNILTQDMARQFLNDSTPKDKYRFFLKGTQLETLNTDYNVIEEGLEVLESKMETLKSDQKVLRKKMEAAVTQARKAANLEKMRSQERECQNQMAWAQVEAMEEALRVIDLEIERVDREISKRRSDAEAHSALYEEVDSAFSEAEQSIERRRADQEPIQSELAEHKELLKGVTGQLGQVIATERKLQSKISLGRRQTKMYQDQIEVARQKQAEADNGQHAQKEQELQNAKVEHDRVRAELTKHNEGLQGVQRAVAKAINDQNDAKLERQSKREEINRTQTNIRGLEGGQRTWMDGYSSLRNLSRLLNAIERESGFRERPIGPMGRYVKLLKPEWSSILERQAGKLLNGFVVTSKADQDRLSELMKRCDCDVQVYIGDHRHTNTSSNEPDPALETWLKVLQFDNDIVRNQMIIHQGIDQVVLFEDRSKGENFMYSDGVHLRNVRMGFMMVDKGQKKGSSITYNAKTGSRSQGPINEWVGPRRMQADKGPQLRAEKTSLERLQRELLSLPDERTFQENLNNCKRDLQEHTWQKQRLTSRIERAQEAVQKIESEISTTMAPDAGLIEQLEESLKDVKEETAFEEGQYQDTSNEKEKLNNERQEHESRIKQVERRVEQLTIELDKARAKADKLRSRRETALREKNAALDRIARAEENKAVWQDKHDEQQNHIEELLVQAERVCPRVDVPRGQTYESLERRLATLVQRREEAEAALGGSEVELYEAANIAKREHQELLVILKHNKDTQDALAQSITTRRRRWERFRAEISTRAKITFTYLLSERQFRGTLSVNHHTRFLDINVQPDITIASGAGRQTKTLSGGEKSFSTICLLLALWDAMGSPIRCLDEFDVFMDSVNRDITMKMIIDAARRAVGRQYIFITPQAMSQVEMASDVKIIRMRDPERGQTALNVQRG
ncbi:dna repair protein-like protein rad18 [Amniculicola lignicola CBS 123094]|uniref:Dna repair protein-like protein rad18 n=1 Tax=Amniculicola lignicola CBS 123094 TaxID=1392246 RepID=A0A6A5X4P0_9PLEO|nr:dna repair protein-like protein rad18 [Amniculicola lignicola CBS 123094]